MQSTDGGPVKIGHSVDVDARRKQLEAHYGTPLAVLATMPGDLDTEAEVHARFEHLRYERTKKRGKRPEQFRPERDLMEFIGRPLLVATNPETVEAMDTTGGSVINLKGSDEYREWLEAFHKHTHIAKTTLVRLGMAKLANYYKFQPPPEI